MERVCVPRSGTTRIWPKKEASRLSPARPIQGEFRIQSFRRSKPREPRKRRNRRPRKRSPERWSRRDHTRGIGRETRSGARCENRAVDATQPGQIDQAGVVRTGFRQREGQRAGDEAGIRLRGAAGAENERESRAGEEFGERFHGMRMCVVSVCRDRDDQQLHPLLWQPADGRYTPPQNIFSLTRQTRRVACPCAGRSRRPRWRAWQRPMPSDHSARAHAAHRPSHPARPRCRAAT